MKQQFQIGMLVLACTLLAGPVLAAGETRPTPTERVQQQREKLQQQLQERQGELKERLSIRNQEAAGRIETMLNKRNEALVQVSMRYVERLASIVIAIERRLAQADIEDPALNVKIADIRAQLKVATQALGDQHAVVYDIDLTQSDSPRQAFQDAFEQLRQDHRRLRTELLGPLRSAVGELWQSVSPALRQESEQVQDR